jgi:hypothetical protein
MSCIVAWLEAVISNQSFSHQSRAVTDHWLPQVQGLLGLSWSMLVGLRKIRFGKLVNPVGAKLVVNPPRFVSRKAPPFAEISN